MPKPRFTEDSYRREPWFRSLVAAIKGCNTEDDLMNFLRDVGTLGELQAWSERFEVAKLLSRGLSYRDVAAKTGASTTTVTRVARFIENGAGGFTKSLNTHRHHRIVNRRTEESVTPRSQEEVQPTPPQASSATEIPLLQKYLQR